MIAHQTFSLQTTPTYINDYVYQSIIITSHLAGYEIKEELPHNDAELDYLFFCI